MDSLICGKWVLTINAPVRDESDISKNNRSYLHYVKHHPDMVSAKAWATKWLLEGLAVDRTREHSAIEYFAGVGVVSKILSETVKLHTHVMHELDKNCCAHLSLQFPEAWVHNMDFKNIAQIPTNYTLRLLDFPSSSIIQMHTKWGVANFLASFKNDPHAVIWTDTSVSYPMSIHGKKYAMYFGVEPVTSIYEYISAYSTWLFERTGYSISRVAKRGTNALYIAALPGRHSYEYKEFPLISYQNGFVIRDGLINYED